MLFHDVTILVESVAKLHVINICKINSGEADRIRSCNGRVFALKEEPHIQRVWLPNENSPGLAMSRAFGDFMLKDHGIIAIPDVSYRTLTSRDRFVVLASDGVSVILHANDSFVLHLKIYLFIFNFALI